ncbi:hypothetical protein BASA50_007383 [Batrachochytrium salamandrivorans]|uniref:4-coumarate-CoA ligase n=1 Tax=Batrachochytrium salamandrivorans TaxID=1357716 RepID=A0ABQ8FAD9_9FUNG|nr:hypothetical protein BASA60_010423 [Batrachochytrium salamandrivorans]KAH6576694.1 hypothetical protein BASA62_001286 [Batrachochytrium salamandrivorans]KAH6587277.1 hypothetical protein BASA61_006341 [Batrachochytrium salamandrivorans]KAH6593432.1 hypothetical protein BASA50_007383 [Batrachochytrium salamandrivorans]KAH9269133.1 hypothetical protein BASA83_008884 [Batrachochytrium salamandrivorans]
MGFKSLFPDIAIPSVDVVTFVLESTAFQANLEKPALIDALNGRTMTFRELRERSHAFASGLINELAFKKGQVVAICSGNSVDYSSIIFGVLLAGGIVTTVNPTYSAQELAHQLKDSGASLVVIGPEIAANAKAAIETVGIRPEAVFMMSLEPADGFTSVFTLFSTKPATEPKFSDDEIANTPAYLAYSSGTTGRSKGVILTHRNIVANVLQIDSAIGSNVIENDSWLGFLPFFHAFALTKSLHQAPYTTVQQYKVASLFVVPPIALALASHPVVDRFDLSSVHRVISGASRLSSDVAQILSKRLNADVFQGYGLTETSPIVSLATPPVKTLGSNGRLVPNMEARIIDLDTGKDLAAGETGELWLRGPNIMKGYFNNAEATADAIDADGYLHTGDIAIIHETGELCIVDRLKELIKYMGIQVPPAELEDCLLQNPKIADVAVIARNDEVSGEVPVAYVVLRPGHVAVEAEIMAFVAERVAPHKQIRGGVVFTESIPKAPTGKILRHILRKMDMQLLSKTNE